MTPNDQPPTPPYTFTDYMIDLGFPPPGSTVVIDLFPGGHLDTTLSLYTGFGPLVRDGQTFTLIPWQAILAFRWTEQE